MQFFPSIKDNTCPLIPRLSPRIDIILSSFVVVRLALLAVMCGIHSFEISHYHDHLVIEIGLLLSWFDVYYWMTVGTGDSFIDTFAPLQDLAGRVVEFSPGLQASLRQEKERGERESERKKVR